VLIQYRQFLLLSGINPVTLWRQLPMFQMELVLIYGVIVLALGKRRSRVASADFRWGRRAAFLWACCPRWRSARLRSFALNTHHFAALLLYLVTVAPGTLFRFGRRVSACRSALYSLAQITPGRFLSSPGLWIGLASPRYFLPQRCGCACRSRSNSQGNRIAFRAQGRNEHEYSGMTPRLELSSVADKSLRAAARFWFGVTLIGQFAFAFSVAAFYGLTALRGIFSLE